MALLDTDLIAVNRGGVDYKATLAELKTLIGDGDDGDDDVTPPEGLQKGEYNVTFQTTIQAQVWYVQHKLTYGNADSGVGLWFPVLNDQRSNTSTPATFQVLEERYDGALPTRVKIIESGDKFGGLNSSTAQFVAFANYIGFGLDTENPTEGLDVDVSNNTLVLNADGLWPIGPIGSQ